MNILERVGCLALLFLVPLAAQVPDPVTAAAAPVAGVGHSYLGQPGETVSPADGIPSFLLPIELPGGRGGLALSFGLRYSGAEPFYVGRYPGTDKYYDIQWIANPASPWEQGGWGYRLPVLTMDGISSGSWETPLTYGEFGPTSWQYHQCDAATDFVFQGLDGVQHTLPIGIIAADVQGDISTGCHAATSPANAEGVLSSTSVPDGDFNGSGPVTATDAAGTVYQFAGAGGGNLIGSQIYHWGVLAGTITDRNGNQLKLSGAPTATANGYVDTLGRTVVSWSGLGGSTGDTVTVAGLSRPSPCTGPA